MKDTIFSYQERTPDYLLVSCIIAYIPAILKHFSKFGLINGIFIVFSAEANNMSLDLEVHGLTYVFGFLGLYYMYCSYVQKKEKKQMCVISIVLMLLGVKRIVIAATALTILLLLLMSKIKGKRRYVVIQLMCIVMIFAAYIYITILKNGTLEQIFNTYNIADNFRMNFANYLRNKYEISPSFLGYGMAYSHRIIVHEYSNIQYLTTAVNIHNDLLGIYLGTGFIGFGIYWYVFFFDRCSLLWKKYGSDSLLFAFLISFYYFMNMLVSNIGLDPFYYSVYFMVISVMCINNNGGKTN